MKIYLDDCRDTPEGFYRCFWPEEVIALLQNPPEPIEIVSLDHDLGEDTRTGYDVLKWVEEQVYVNNYAPPMIVIHSANAPARMRMEAALKSIYKDRP